MGQYKPAQEPKAEGTNTGHENAEGMASVGVRVEPTVRTLLLYTKRFRCIFQDCGSFCNEILQIVFE